MKGEKKSQTSRSRCDREEGSMEDQGAVRGEKAVVRRTVRTVSYENADMKAAVLLSSIGQLHTKSQ